MQLVKEIISQGNSNLLVHPWEAMSKENENQSLESPRYESIASNVQMSLKFMIRNNEKYNNVLVFNGGRTSFLQSPTRSRRST